MEKKVKKNIPKIKWIEKDKLVVEKEIIVEETGTKKDSWDTIKKESSVYIVIENGVSRSISEKEKKMELQYFTISGEVDGIKYKIVDFDKTKVRPLVKDILNRQWMFLEIIMLNRLFWTSILSILAIVIFFTLSPGKSYISTEIQKEGEKIINACQSVANVQTQTQVKTNIIPHVNKQYGN